MPDPDLDEVARKIEEAKQYAREVRQPEAEADEAMPSGSSQENDEDSSTSS